MATFEIKNYFAVGVLPGQGENGRAYIEAECHSKLPFAAYAASEMRNERGFSKKDGGFAMVLAGVVCEFDPDTGHYVLPDGLETDNESDVYLTREEVDARKGGRKSRGGGGGRKRSSGGSGRKTRQSSERPTRRTRRAPEPVADDDFEDDFDDFE